MAAAIGASTGAMITAAVMLHEMTDDNNVVLPVITTAVVACGVRKLISPGSVYTLKLLRRGHVVPEGLQAALDDARSVEHVMSRRFQVVDEEAALEPIPGVVVVERDGRAVRVVHPFGRIGEGEDEQRPDGDEAFVVLAPRTPLVEAMREMQEAGVGCALVFDRPDTDRVEHLVGVVTLRELSEYRTRVAELL
jgi:CIC family chloride channel protein